MQSEGSRLFPLHLRIAVLLLLVFRPVLFPPLEPHTQSSRESFRPAVWLDPGPKEKIAGHDIKRFTDFSHALHATDYQSSVKMVPKSDLGEPQ